MTLYPDNPVTTIRVRSRHATQTLIMTATVAAIAAYQVTIFALVSIVSRGTEAILIR